MEKSKASGETTHAVGDIIWVKITRGKWWPAEVVAPDKCPEEVTRGLRKQPLAIAKYFDEDYYEIVKSVNHILPFVCPRKSEFIRKGRELLKQDPNAEKFNKDVAEAEKICGVPSEDVYDFCNSYGDNGPPSPYSNHYTLTLSKKNKHNTYGSAMVSSSTSGAGQSKPARRLVQSYGGEGDTAYRDTMEDGDSEGGVGETFRGTDVRIRTQPSPAVTPKWAAYSCDVCGFQTGRIANIIVHGRSHSDALRRWVDSGCGVRDRPTALFHSDTTSKRRKKDANHHHTSKVQRLKRKLMADGSAASPRRVDGKDKQSKQRPEEPSAELVDDVNEIDGEQSPAPKKRGPKPKLNEDGTPVNKKRGLKPVLNEDGTPVHKKRGPKPALNEDGTPVAKKRKKKEDDADSIFDKIKRQTVRKNSRGRPRGSGVGGGASSFLGIGGLGHRRRAGSDGSSDEDEFLISRGVYEKEEEEEEAAAAGKNLEEGKEKADEEVAAAADAPHEHNKVSEEAMDVSEVTDGDAPKEVDKTDETIEADNQKVEVAEAEVEEVDVGGVADSPAIENTAEAEPKEKPSTSAESPRAAHGYGSTATKSTSYLTSQQPEDLTSQPEDLTPQREEGVSATPSTSVSEDDSEDRRPAVEAQAADASEEEDDEAAPAPAPKSREDSSSPPQDLTTHAEDLTSRPVDLSTLQEEEEPSSGGLPEDASTLLEVSTSLLEDSASLLQSSASLLQDSASLLGGAGPSSSSVGLLLPDSTGNSEDWPAARSTVGKSSHRLWPHRSEEEWGADDDAGQESVSSPRPDSHATSAQLPRVDEVSTSDVDVLRHLGLVPVVESAPSSRTDAEDAAALSAPHYGRDTPSSSDALQPPTVGTTDHRRSPSGGSGSSTFREDPEESTTTTSERVTQTADDVVSQTDADDRVSQTDDERISHHATDDDRVSHTDDRISQSDDGNSHQYEDDRISQTDYRISQTSSYDASHPDYHHHHQASQQLDYRATASPYSELSDRSQRPDQHEMSADHLVSQTGGPRLSSTDDHQPKQSSSSAHHHEPMSSFDSYADVSEGLVEEEVVPDVCAEEELVADQSEERVRPSGIDVDDESADLAVDSSEVVVEGGGEEEEEEEVVVDQSVIEEECVSQVVECSTALESCVIVGEDAQSAIRELPSSSPHEHWSQHVIDENGMVVAAPPDDDIYADPALSLQRHDDYGGYMYGVPHSTATGSEMEDHGDHVIEVDVMSSTTSHRRMDADALSVAMESADVPVAMEADETGGHHEMDYGADEASASMAGHVGLASSDELLASIPMPPPLAASDGQQHYLPPLPSDDGEYRPPLPPPPMEDEYRPPLPPADEVYQPPLPPTDDYPPPPPNAYGTVDGVEEEEGPRYTKLEAMVQPADDGDVYLEDVGQEIQVESEQVIGDMDMFCGEEVIIDSVDRSQMEYDMCMVQEETVEATEQSFEVEMGSSEVSKMPALVEEELGVNGGVGMDNGLSFGHAR